MRTYRQYIKPFGAHTQKREAARVWSRMLSAALALSATHGPKHTACDGGLFVTRPFDVTGLHGAGLLSQRRIRQSAPETGLHRTWKSLGWNSSGE